MDFISFFIGVGSTLFFIMSTLGFLGYFRISNFLRRHIEFRNTFTNDMKDQKDMLFNALNELELKFKDQLEYHISETEKSFSELNKNISDVEKLATKSTIN